MEPIGYVLARVGDDPRILRFRHRGSYGAVAQAGFVAVIGAVTFALVGPVVGYLTWALAAVQLLGAIGNGVIAWDLTLDTTSRTWRLRSGYRFWQRRVEGTFDDFARVVLAEGRPRGWWIHLVPKGSARGYVIEAVEAERGRAAVEALWRGYAKTLGVPAVEEDPSDREVSGSADIGRPPAGSELVARQLGNGWEVDVTPYRRVFKDLVRVTPEALEIVRRLSTPTGPSDAVRKLPWANITQILVSPLILGRTASGGPKAAWHVRRDWRADMHQLWAQRRRELKQPPRPMPWWGLLWYFVVEGKWRRSAKAVMVFSNLGEPEQFGDDSRLGAETIEWLCSALIAWHRAHGGRPLQEA
ncbi:MAG TPA: hypothetical protein VF384_17535 [Planctomycetota bacterium]